MRTFCKNLFYSATNDIDVPSMIKSLQYVLVFVSWWIQNNLMTFKVSEYITLCLIIHDHVYLIITYSTY